MVNTINGWIQVRNNFVKKVGEKEYDVIRLVDLDEFTYYETYYKVNVDDVTEGTFSTYGDYNEFINEKTDEEKAVYTATFGFTYDHSYTCHNDREITNVLLEDGVISEGEAFQMEI